MTDDLRKHGMDGFFDAYSIKPGDQIPSEIQRGLESCEVYVPMLSPAALASRWSELEINTAITLERNHGHPRIVPIIIESCIVPTLLQSMLHISFIGRYDDALNELLKVFGIQTVPSNVVLPLQRRIIVTPTPAIKTLPRTIINPRDGKEMILIPAGEFVMGNNEENNNEKPPHKIYLDAFYISRYPVTNADYKKFVDATNSNPPNHWSSGEIPQGRENHPVVRVTWYDAVNYCNWAGVRLPTEAEWEKAASWNDAKKEKYIYPWGDRFDASKCNTNESQIGNTTAVGKYSPQGDSPYGIADMAGNVWEWCTNWHKESCENSQGSNPEQLSN